MGLWTCPKCHREFKNKNQSHSCVIYPLENHFKGKEEVAKPLFDELVRVIEREIGPVKIESLPCCVYLVSDYTFGAVWALKKKIKVDFRVDFQIDDPRIIKDVKMSANRYLYFLEITDRKQIDEQLIEWLRASYFLSNVD